MLKNLIYTSCVSSLLISGMSYGDIAVKMVKTDLTKSSFDESVWKDAVDSVVELTAQPMTTPKPKVAETTSVKVSAIHDGKWIAFRLKWADTEKSEMGKLAKFSDAVALQFPVKSNENPPPIMMGFKDDPVHIYHWRYTYQMDAEQGIKTVDKIYPNMTTDMYPLDYKVKGNYKEATRDQKESFVGGTAAGNAQSFAKSGVDEIFAEGFGSSAVIENPESKGKGTWKNNEWTVVIARPLAHQGGSVLEVGKKSHAAFAVWQGGKQEVGGRKALTMAWSPILIENAAK